MEDAERGNKGCQLANRKEVMCTKGEAMTNMTGNIKQFNKSKKIN
jgi:hypothetical protein